MADLSEVANIINIVFNMFLTLEVIPGIPLNLLIGFCIALGATITAMLNNSGGGG